MQKEQKNCGNCYMTQPFNDTHVICLNMECKSCNCLKAKTTGGCKKWKGSDK